MRPLPPKSDRLLGTLVTLAVALASYCLDYQTREAYRVGDQLFELPVRANQLVPSPILLKFGEVIIKQPGAIDKLRSIGFSAEEIRAWANQQRATLRQAGFSRGVA